MENLDHKRKITIMIAIMSAMLFAALNQTIVGTALPRIVSDLGGIEYFNWVFTIFMLTSSVTAILVGKLSDIYGRKPFILIGIGIFIVGSLLCGTAGTIIHLIAYRGIQGLGAGMIMSTAFTAVGDLFSPRERGRWQGLMGSVFGLASVFGPTLGGWIVDHIHWKWVFWVFLPFGIIAFLLIVSLFPTTERRPSEKIDYLGSILITFIIVPVLLAFSWAGNQYEWTSYTILGLFTASIISLLLFIQVERKVTSPVLPLDLFKNDIFSLSNGIGFLLGAGMFGTIMYMPFFVQGVIGTSATASGLIMMPMTLSMVASSSIIGQYITKTGKYKIFALGGLLLMTAGLISMSFMSSETSNLVAVMNMIIVGFGLGACFPVFTLTVQNAVSHSNLGVATASTQLFRQIGGTVGVAVLGSVMTIRMEDKMKELVAGLPPETDRTGLANFSNPQILMNPDQLDQAKNSLTPEMLPLFEQLVGTLRESLAFSLTGVFLIGAAIMTIAFLLTFFLREIPLRHSNNEDKQAAAE
ncbi:EmrB/QacA subfamily drug resistance transporter [Bacillus mesophilus]|uniref:MFS transporter n=1 Tax=Bacillus mesophilus TaxID=1808955 RepID=A0A6M0QCE5_9BACI|nr:MDR family MFS transporter [Bacillus mesophilus]MBM7662553.1 EmrB/QacA subfamily drug resistance transporter [Bacillus mesophilus]NEY73379.1 MFS transporter [Bacillus mesophilus]